MRSSLQSVIARRAIGLSSLALLGLVAGGCKSTPSMGQYDVQVRLDKSMMRADNTFPTVEVDLVGVNPDADGERWNDYSVTRYFSPGDTMRAGEDKFRMVFRSGKNDVQTLVRTDRIWKRWRDSGVMTMYVLASLPGVHEDKAGASDDRRLIVPLDKRRWDVKTLRLVLRNSGITLLDQPKPAP